MRGLTMDYQLTVPAILRRTDALFAGREVVSRRADRSLHRYRYADCLARARRLGAALRLRLGVGPGDRVATLCWSHHRHLEAYYGVPSSGAVLHTLNVRLHPDELAYVATHAEDRVAIVDASLLPLFDEVRRRVGRETFAHVVVIGDGVTDGDLPAGAIDYESLLASVSDDEATANAAAADAAMDERDAAMLCYTSGTTGRPKGVLYSHRALALHALAAAAVDAFALSERDCVLAVVAMYHANAWGLPYAAALVGARQVLPGAYFDAASALELVQSERVTFAAGVPTVWLGVLEHLAGVAVGSYDLSSLREVLIGGAAVPASLVRTLEERHGVRVLQGWGMTETAPSATVSRATSAHATMSAEERHAQVARQGVPVPFVELRARTDDGAIAPRDDATMGEVEVRGAWVASRYYGDEDDADGRFTTDGWLRTGDVMTIDGDGCATLRDRAKDLVKSGGEWISSVALENALMAHPQVAEAAVVAVAHPRWGERPLAVVVPRTGGEAPTHASLVEYLAPRFAKWWLPDATVVVPALPKTSTGKTRKAELRALYHDHLLALTRPAEAGAAVARESEAATGDRGRTCSAAPGGLG